MSKKITSVEELLKRAKECEELIKIRKKWKDLKDLIKIKVGVPSKEKLALENTNLVIKAIIDLIEGEEIENISLYKTEFLGYGGVFPSLEIIIPNKGNVTFGNVEPQEAVRLIKKYLKDTAEIEYFLTDNDGTKECDH